MKRREFLKTSLAASAIAGLGAAGSSGSAAEPGAAEREYYELRIYRFKSGSKTDSLEGYLEKAAIPALNRLGSQPVGVFTERDAKDAPAIYVLIPYPSLTAFSEVTSRLLADPELQKAGASYLETPANNPGFDRIESWLMLAFAGMPKIELPAYSRERKPRMFELRIYPSYSEVKALKKVEMFNKGEMDVMRETGLAPVFYGQTLIGSGLPQLTYMLSAENQEAHSKHWQAFGSHPTWKKMRSDPEYADTVIEKAIKNHFLLPTAYSQI
ncbi:MAG TPA: NIPSNAP family protein [Verrucomicrobiae bacterium]|nr:NIPSNAP family protein [Verrucomicrobiae bacterium]